MTAAFKPETVSLFKKRRFLLEMSESEFRDEVLRPLFLRQGLKDGRDLCGPSEEGKDALFVSTDQLGIEDVYVVQTKKGKVNLASKAGANLLDIVAQLRTAAGTKISFIKSKTKKLPAKVFLCASGTVNQSAKNHICEEVSDPRLFFLDSDDLIPKIDELFPELWLGIDAEIAPYFRKLKQVIESSDETLAMAELLPRDSQAGVATDQGFVTLQLYRMALRVEKQRGQMVKVPHFEQMPATSLLTKRKKRLFAIFGGAGSGKSTCLKRMAYVLATRGLKFESADKIFIPILLRAVDVAGNSDRSIVELCDAECRRLTGLSTAAFSAQDLTAGKLFVLIDALDELPDDKGRISVVSLLQDFHASYPDCTVVLTSRDHNSVKSLEVLRNFEKYNLSPINYKQAQQIIKTVQKGKSLPAEKSHELVRRLEEVHGMELNPLLVTIFAATTEYSRQDIPANVTELFKKFTEMMLGRWDASKGFKQQYHAPLKDFILKKIAFQMHTAKQTKLDVEQFESILRTELANRGYEADVQQLRDEILYRSGLFIVLDRTVEFRHLLMQEFFAGRGIPSLEYLHTVIADPWWRRAVVFYFGENPGNPGALDSAITSVKERSTEQNYEAALTLGLALQACYLVEVKDKLGIYRWVIGAISDAKDEFLTADPDYKRRPTSRFVLYYLFGRDSVALSVLHPRVQEILAGLARADLKQDDADVRKFWVIVGLMESGDMDEVEQLLKTFKPSDSRLLLGIHLGAYLTHHVRVCTKEQSSAAKRICDSLAARIQHLRTTLLQEFKSELLELREGTLAEIDQTSEENE